MHKHTQTMTSIHSFVHRLSKIGIKVELIGNYPWVYLDKVNGIKVKGRLQANHGFTVFFRGQHDTITDIPLIFNKIRETITQNT